MAERVDLGCTADRRSVFTNVGVSGKTPFSSSFSSGVESSNPNNNLQQAFNQVDAQEDKMRCRCGHGYRAMQNGLWSHGQQIVVFLAVLFSCSALLISICCLVYVSQLGEMNASHIQVLNQKVQRLDSVCGDTSQLSASQLRAVTGTTTDISDPELHQLPWQHNANRLPPSAAKGAHDEPSTDKNLEEGRKEKSALSEDDVIVEQNAHTDSSDLIFLSKSRQKRSSNGKRKARRPNGPSGPTQRTKREGKKKPRVCKKLENCIKKKKNGGKVKGSCRKMLKCIPPPVPAGPKAMHFTADYLRNERQQKFGRETPLRFNKEAPWMADMYKDKSKQPLVPLQDGGFNVTQSGIYYLYSSVMFHDVKPRHSQALVKNGEKLFKCMDSVDYVDTSVDLEEQHKYKTCTITGVALLKVGDRLEVQNLYSQTEIDLVEDASFFGAVLLTPL